MRPKEGRTIGLYTKVSPQEKELIDKKMALLGVSNQRAYLRKMAVDGYIVKLDMEEITDLVSLLRRSSNSLNQIAKKVNATGTLYGADIASMQVQQDEIWELVKEILARLSTIQ